MITKKNIFSGILVASLLAFALPALAKTTLPTATVQCIGQAVALRETALGTAMTEYTRSANIGYADRAAALQAAYASTDQTTIKNAVKSAWSKFDVFMKSVKKKWSMSRTESWANFRAAAKACKSPSDITDSGNVSMEVAGN